MVGTSRLIQVATKEFPRYSEADLIELPDHSLFLALARKTGSTDFSPGELISLTSTDAGLTWSDTPRLLLQSPTPDITDLMSVSLLRSPRALHLFFLGRGTSPKSDTRVYQMLSTDHAATWSHPVQISSRPGYHIVNNARAIRTPTGRILLPCAFVPGDILKLYKQQHVFCLYSDDDGQSWHESAELSLPTSPLMEPGIAQCADGSLYMTLRTQLKQLYQSRSTDNGSTWSDPSPTNLPAPEAPSTVHRDPTSDALWLFWCDRPDANWKGRSRQVFASSNDNGHTWSPPRPIEDDPRHSYGYISVTPVRNHILLTYYDWQDNGQPNFHLTSLRQRTIPIDWFHNLPTPPVFAKHPTPVLTADQKDEGKILSLNSGLLTPKDRWRLWYTNGILGPQGEHLSIHYAESKDQGLTWTKIPLPHPIGTDTANYYHPSIHQLNNQLILHAWSRTSQQNSALYRFTSSDDGQTFTPNPDHPLIASHNATPQLKSLAGPDRISNDAFDLLLNPNGSYEYFAPKLQKTTNPQSIIPQDNAPGLLRLISHATSPDGIRFSPTDIILRPSPTLNDPPDEQFYAMQVIYYRHFYLALLQTFHTTSQTIQPEFAWSHDGQNFVRTRTPALPLGDEGTFDSRMILFGSLTLTDQELIYLYAGYNWRHNAYRQSEVSSSIGRATLPLLTLNAWLDTLPQP